VEQEVTVQVDLMEQLILVVAVVQLHIIQLWLEQVDLV
jgi:hypothetical protein